MSQEKFEDSKRLFRSRKWKDKQCNGKTKRLKWQTTMNRTLHRKKRLQDEFSHRGQNRIKNSSKIGRLFQLRSIYPTVTSARSCNKVDHLFWFTILAQHETNDVILYIHSVHKHRGNSFQRQNYKMRLKQRSLNWINSMQVKKILFTNVFFSWSLCLLNMFPSMVFPKHFYLSGLLT